MAMLQKKLQSLFPESTIKVEDVNGTVTLTGQVHDLESARQAELISVPYSGANKIVDLLEVGGGQQVMLKVKFAEVSKQAEKELGFNFGGNDGNSVYGSNLGNNTLGIDPGRGETILLAIPAGTLSTASMFGTGEFANIAFAYFVDSLEANSLLRTLAEPNLVTTSGQKATFLAGGSFPYPVPQSGTGGGSTITIQFQPYGVSLTFTPIVLGNGRIRLDVNPDVNELDFSHTVTLDGTTVPGLTDRNVHTTVELAEGQTYALAGLLQDQISASNSQFPILGDIPILALCFARWTIRRIKRNSSCLSPRCLSMRWIRAVSLPFRAKNGATRPAPSFISSRIWVAKSPLRFQAQPQLSGTRPRRFEGAAGFNAPPTTTPENEK